MAEWYLATYQNGVFSNDLGIIQPSEDSVYKLKNGIQSTKSPVKSDWLRISITDKTVKEWNGSSWTDPDDTSLTGLVNGSVYWVYGFIVKYIIVTNDQTYYLETLDTLNTISNITHVTITNLVTEIGANAFNGINDNVIFIIPEGVLTKLNEADTSLGLTYGIGKDFFGASSAILVKDYPYYTFITNTNRIHYLQSFSNNIDTRIITGSTIDDITVTIDPTSITHVIIGNSVTSIGYGAFQQCSSLVSLTIGNSVTSIGGGAFLKCTSLASLIIPNSVETIGYEAFDSNTTITLELGIKLTSFPDISSVSSLNSNDFITDNVNNLIINKHTNALLVSTNSSRTSADIPINVTSIGDGAFYGCFSLASVTIPDSVTSIGGGAFLKCTSLASVNIPDSVETIGNNAFQECTSLTSVTMGESLTSIGDGAFSGCSSLASLNIPDSVTTIGENAFYGINSSNSSTEAKITISQSTVRSLTNDNKYISGNQYPPEIFFSDSTEVILNVI